MDLTSEQPITHDIAVVGVHGGGVDRTTALSRLPEPYAVALRLHDEGLDDRIAGHLGIDPAGVPAMLELAEAKLARLTATDRGER